MKTTLITVLLFTLHLAKAQFELTPQGFETVEGKSYLVLEVPDQTQAELYAATLKYLHSIYNSPKEVLSTLENEVIKVTAKQPDAVRRTNHHRFDVAYALGFEFKDGRVKVDAPGSLQMSTYTTQWQVLELQANNAIDGSRLGIWNNKGKLKSELAKQDLENFFNGLINGLEKALKADSEW